MFKVSMAVSLLLVSAAASAHSGLQIEAGRAQGSEHSLVRFDAAQTVAFASKKPPAKAEEPKAEPVKEEAVDPATYKPKTAHDNTPWRFDMSQNGKRMTAEEFDAWMKARGVRVAKGAPKPAAAPVPTPAPAEAPKGN